MILLMGALGIELTKPGATRRLLKSFSRQLRGKPPKPKGGNTVVIGACLRNHRQMPQTHRAVRYVREQGWSRRSRLHSLVYQNFGFSRCGGSPTFRVGERRPSGLRERYRKKETFLTAGTGVPGKPRICSCWGRVGRLAAPGFGPERHVKKPSTRNMPPCRTRLFSCSHPHLTVWANLFRRSAAQTCNRQLTLTTL
jgi:hypothetical protein